MLSLSGINQRLYPETGLAPNLIKVHDFLVLKTRNCDLIILHYVYVQDEKYDIHSLNVLKTMKSVETKGTTYLIIFETSLHDYKNRNPQTFQTKIFMSPVYLPTMKIDIRFVRTKAN